MGVATTHYLMLGVVIQDKQEVKQFFQNTSEKYELIDEYDDNGYKDEITPTPSGLHIIADGMNGGYVVFGKILAKDLQGLELTTFDLLTPPGDVVPSWKKTYNEIYPEILKIDEKFGTKIGGKDPQIIAFTHWH